MTNDQGPWLITVTPVPDDPQGRTPVLVYDDYEGLSTRCPDCDGHIMGLDEDEAFVYGLADTMAGHVCEAGS